MKRVLILAILLAALLLIAASGVLVFIRSSGGPGSATVAALLAFGAFFLLLRIDVSGLMRAADQGRGFLPILAFMIVTTFVAPTSATLHFDEIGAQVIVVLLLALAIDTRFFRLHPVNDRLEVAAICFTMLVLGAGEFYALKGLFTNQPSHGEMVAGAIAAGFVAVAVSALAGFRQRRPDDEAIARSEKRGS